MQLSHPRGTSFQKEVFDQFPGALFHRPRCHQSVCVRSSNCLKEFPNNNKKHRPRCHRPISVPRKSRHARSKNETISYRDFYVTSGSMEILKMTNRPLGHFNAQRRIRRQTRTVALTTRTLEQKRVHPLPTFNPRKTRQNTLSLYNSINRKQTRVE